MTFVYPNEGCGKTLLKITDTIPHTVVDMEYQGTECTYPMNLHEVSVVPSRPFNKKTSTFSFEDLRKTLSQYVMSDGITAWHDKCRKSFSNGQHSPGYCSKVYSNLKYFVPFLSK